MPFVLVQLKADDYREWKRVMEEHVPKRRALGSTGTRIFRDAERPDQIFCLTEWGSFEKAREFMNWGDPAEIARRSTRAGDVTVRFLDEVDGLPA